MSLLLDTNVLCQVAGSVAALAAWTARQASPPVVSAVSLWEMAGRPALDVVAGLPVRPVPVASLAEGRHVFDDLVRAALDPNGRLGTPDPRALAIKWGPHALTGRVATDSFRALVAERLRGPAEGAQAVVSYIGQMLVDLAGPVPPHRNDTADFFIFLSLAKGDGLLTADARFAARAHRALSGSGFATVLRVRPPK